MDQTLYNPHEQSKEELISRFVVRHEIFRKIFDDISSSKMIYPEQHILIEGQRGMGKTTLLLRLKYQIEKTKQLKKWLIPIIFKEELHYSVYSLVHLWENIAKQLEYEFTDFIGLSNEISEYKSYDDYERRAFNAIRKALNKHSKKLILFIDNLGEMFLNFNKLDAHRLREILLQSNQIRIIGATSVVLESYFDYKHAFYEFFKKISLKGLGIDETKKLLIELSQNSKEHKKIQSIIKNQPERINSLRILTGGVIRTIILFYEILIHNKDGKSITDLSSILDKVTPLYQSRMGDLTSNQREIVHILALNWDSMSAKEIITKTNYSEKHIQGVLEELEQLYLVEKNFYNKETVLFQIRERFFNIWYLMRVTPEYNNKVIWLVKFLETWYSQAELKMKAVDQIISLSLGKYDPKAAYYMAEALASTSKLDLKTEHDLILATKKYLKVKDRSLLDKLSPSDFEKLNEGQILLNKGQPKKALSFFSKMRLKDSNVNFLIGQCHFGLNNIVNSEKYFLKAFELGNKESVTFLSSIYFDDKKNKKKINKGEKYFLKHSDNNTEIQHALGHFYEFTKPNFKKAEKYYLSSLKEHTNFDRKYYSRSRYFCIAKFYEFNFKNYKLASSYYKKGWEIGDEECLKRLVYIHTNHLKNSKLVKKYLLEGVKNKIKYADLNLAHTFEEEKDYKNAEKYYKLSASNEVEEAYFALASMYTSLDKPKKAFNLLLKNRKQNIKEFDYSIGFLYQNHFDDNKNAIKYYKSSLRKGNHFAATGIGMIYHSKNRYDLAEKYYKLGLKSEEASSFNNLGWFYIKSKLNKKLAHRNIQKSIELAGFNKYNRYNIAWYYIWTNNFNKAYIHIKKILTDKDMIESSLEDISNLLILLISKERYSFLKKLFNDSKYNLIERFKPVYYAYLGEIKSNEYHKMPPEIKSTVLEIKNKIDEFKIRYS